MVPEIVYIVLIIGVFAVGRYLQIQNALSLAGDTAFGILIIIAGRFYLDSALQLETSFLSDPMGSKTFPVALAGLAVICGGVMVLKPDAEPEWPGAGAFVKLVISVVAMVAYAYALKPMGFLVPTALAAGVLSYLIAPRPVFAVLAGLGLSVGLFFIFKYALGLSLVAFPKGLF
ncbi:MAG: tripartite tricarboxylate transporter TctB family protein [Boseongicola sp.]|nr:tripartite tricarboxylate transporter TctB family protein [Boseongicola sp.]NNL74465.1 tripartite tricarboxylate transporter TctB family protein [Silicimonas sp.]